MVIKTANKRAQGTDFNPLKSHRVSQRNWNKLNLLRSRQDSLMIVALSTRPNFAYD
jgi:hypothetical protein